MTAATVGVSRKPLPLRGNRAGAAPAKPAAARSADPATALLDAAALEVVARRAGYQPPRGVTPPAAPVETAPAFSARAARALREACGWQAGQFPPDNPLLADLLGAAASAGYVAHPLLLPGLLDVAVKRTALRPPVAAVLGTRGRWLAGHRADWSTIAGRSPAEERPPAEERSPAEERPPAEERSPADPSAPEGLSGSGDRWRVGRSAERISYLADLRQRDADAARDLLAASWERETGADRGRLIATLERGLSVADEAFLEAALGDRAGAVRDEARRLLARLPGSAFGRRAGEEAGRVLRLEQGALVATMTGPRLTEVIAAAPLAGWTARFGLRPREIVALPVSGGASADVSADVRAGWRRAAVSQGDAEWLAALLAGLPLTTVNPPGWGGGRQETGAPLLDAITGWPGTWPEVLAAAVLAVFGRVRELAVLPSGARMLLTAAGRGLPATGPVDYAQRLTRMADACPHGWVTGLRATAETVLLRRVFLRETGRG